MVLQRDIRTWQETRVLSAVEDFKIYTTVPVSRDNDIP